MSQEDTVQRPPLGLLLAMTNVVMEVYRADDKMMEERRFLLNGTSLILSLRRLRFK